jgi:hypothetical protein
VPLTRPETKFANQVTASGVLEQKHRSMLSQTSTGHQITNANDRRGCRSCWERNTFALSGPIVFRTPGNAFAVLYRKLTCSRMPDKLRNDWLRILLPWLFPRLIPAIVKSHSRYNHS